MDQRWCCGLRARANSEIIDKKRVTGGRSGCVDGRRRYRRNVHRSDRCRPAHRAIAARESTLGVRPIHRSPCSMRWKSSSRTASSRATSRMFVHGTTVATNALLEGKGVRTGLLITRGFRAVYEARGWSQPRGSDLLDTFYQKPPLLAPQWLTEEVTRAARLSWRGRHAARRGRCAARFACIA